MSKPQRISSWGQEVTLQLAQFDPKQFGRVGVLMGGRSAERGISPFFLLLNCFCILIISSIDEGKFFLYSIKNKYICKVILIILSFP